MVTLQQLIDEKSGSYHSSKVLAEQIFKYLLLSEENTSLVATATFKYFTISIFPLENGIRIVVQSAEDTSYTLVSNDLYYEDFLTLCKDISFVFGWA